MSDAVVRFENVGKMYKIFSSKWDNLMDALGFDRRIAREGERFSEFWALRGIDLELRRGERVGIIGRNGAGKSTLLKLVTGNMAPSEGHVEINGQVQALLDIGGGLHPEFTGRENAEASLSFLGLGRREIATAIEDIADFTELGRFLDQPFKTYSLGMQARLSLGIATTIEPEILIIDEILGAGDAYFFAKSTRRMEQLLGSGASVLLVSHALNQVARFCDRTIWIDRGRIVMEGRTIEVVKAYEKFTSELETRRLMAKNQKARAGGFDGFERDGYTDALVVRIRTEPGVECDVSEISLFRDSELEERVLVGHAQDADAMQAAHVVLEGGSWTGPVREGGDHFRRIEAYEGMPAVADALIHLWFFYPQASYRLRVVHRTTGAATIEVSRQDELCASARLRNEGAETWEVTELALDDTGSTVSDDRPSSSVTISHWTGLGGLAVEEVALLAEDDSEQTVFAVEQPLRIRFTFKAREADTYVVIPIALIFRDDGLVMTRHIGPQETIELGEDDRGEAILDLGPLKLGNGNYLVTVALYKSLDPIEASLDTAEFYDIVDRSYEFQVVGNPPLHNELFRHPGEWAMRVRQATATLRRVV
jgi:lipopolysaccharide transport system ATP-binding protein